MVSACVVGEDGRVCSTGDACRVSRIPPNEGTLAVVGVDVVFCAARNNPLVVSWLGTAKDGSSIWNAPAVGGALSNVNEESRCGGEYSW